MPDLKELADAIVANNDFDAAIIVCPKGEAGGTMTLAIKKKKGQGDKNVFEGTEILWKDLARVIGSGGQPAIIDRGLLSGLVGSSRKFGEVAMVAQAANELYAKAMSSGHWPKHGQAHPLNSAMSLLLQKIAAASISPEPPSGTGPRNPGE